MSPYIQNVADNVETFAKYLEEQKDSDGKKVDLNMGVVEYRDITCDGKDSTIVHTIDGSPWHRTTSELVTTLELIKSSVDGGGDTPETLFDALGYVTDEKTLKFRSDAHKFVIVLSDANYKENNNFGLNKSSLLEKLEKQKINTSVITEKYYFDEYKDIIGSTGIVTDIRSKTFSDDLLKLADVIKKTIDVEVIDTVIKPVKSIKVTCKGDNTIKVGNSATLNAIILPETADDKNVEWMVDDESIASIDVSSDTMTCKVTGEKEGETKVTAVTADGGFTGSYKIKIISDSSSDNTIAIEIAKDDMTVTPAKKTINKQKSFNIKVALTKDFMDDKEQEEIDDIWENDIDSITYRSSKSSIASVNKKGKVTGKKKGKAIIKTTVTLSDGKEYNYRTTVYVK